MNAVATLAGPHVHQVRPKFLRWLDGTAMQSHRLAMPTNSADTDTQRAALIVAIAEKADRSAFIALFEFYAPRIKAQAMRYGLDAAAAEDIAQDAMLSVWRRAGQFDAERGTASAWVFTIATNARIDKLRRDRILASSVELDTDSLLLSVDATDGLGADSARLEGYMRKLPDEQRRILHLSFFADLPHSEIAQKLGVPLGTVKSRIRLAIAKLRQALGGEP
jgi:RNA polymerase sigma-70 factor (ECF subfamily)